jgi:outer membrane cobalamin receptor
LKAPAPPRPYLPGELIESRQGAGIEAIGTVRVITASDIEAMGARTLDEALALVPGLFIRVGAAGEPRVDVRGYRTRHVQLLFDGIPMHSTYDGQFDPSFVPVENIDHVKVMLSQSSLLYGDGPLGGVINVITKEGAEGVHGRLRAETKSGKEWSRVFELSTRSRRWSSFMSGSAHDLNGFELSDDFTPTANENGGTRTNSDRERRNLFASLSHTTTDGLVLGAVVQGTRGEFGRPPTTADRSIDPFASRPRFERVESLEGVSGHVSALWDGPGSLRVRSWLYLNQRDEKQQGYDDGTYTSLNDPTVSGSFKSDDRILTQGGAVHASWATGTRGRLTVGVLGRDESYDSEGFVQDVRVSGGGGGGGGGGGSGGGGGGGSGGGGATYEIRPIDVDRTTRTFTGAIEYEAALPLGVRLVAGYSLSWFDPDGASGDRAGSGLMGVAWDVRDGTRLRASVSRRHRFPSIRQLFEYEAGNPALRTETSRTWEVGIEQSLPKNSRVTLVGFYSDVDDYIEKLDESRLFENSETYRMRGFELEVQTRFRPGLDLRSSYSLLDTEDRSPGAWRDDLQNRPRHRLTFQGRYRFARGLSVQGSVDRVVDSYVYTRGEPYEQGSLDDYTLINGRVSQDLLDGRAALYVMVENLLDENYEDSYGFPQRGRTLGAGIELRF